MLELKRGEIWIFPIIGNLKLNKRIFVEQKC